MRNEKIISVVLGTFNRLKFLKLTIDTIRVELGTIASEIIVIDGGSKDGTIAWLTSQKDIITIVQYNHGQWRGKDIERRNWGYFMNLGLKCAQGKYICMLSDDCLVVPGAIKNGITLFEKELKSRKQIGAVAFYWRDWPEEKKYKVGKTLNNYTFVNHGLYLNNVLKKINYIDENTYKFYHADGDLCLQMVKAGYRCIASPKSFVEHYSHNNSLRIRKSKFRSGTEDWERYLSKWRKIFNKKEIPAGGWIYKSFADKERTASKFPSPIYIKLRSILYR